MCIVQKDALAAAEVDPLYSITFRDITCHASRTNLKALALAQLLSALLRKYFSTV
jgi:hypothetical protein